MMRRWLFVQWLGMCLLASNGPVAARADEGMWLFTDLPRERLREKYGFEPQDDWADHVRRASVRFNSGGSASFVSSSGLVLTNHHVGADTLHKISTPENNYYEDGFYAAALADEIPAPDLELNQLVSIQDVTARVNAAVPGDLPAAEAVLARRAVIADIEQESLDETGFRSDVITLYGGARYHLYRYKKYTDVRLVWAPEAAIAFFGGDADNFEYPRFCLDVCIFRVYEHDQPARIDNFLRINEQGPAENELVFVSGNPGRTQRIYTLAALKHERDVHLPYVLNYLRRREILFQQFGLQGEEQERRARDDLFGVQNSRKALTGMLQGLQDPSFFQQKQQQERALMERVRQDPELREHAQAWQTVADVAQREAELQGQVSGFSNRLYRIAESIVLLAAEDPKPNAERLPEYSDSNRESLLQQLYSPAPIYGDLEQAKLADSLSLFVELRGGDDPLSRRVLDGKNPGDRAAELVSGTQLTDVAVRKQLVAGGAAAVEASPDPLIRLARSMEAEMRRLRTLRDELSEREQQAYGRIADVLFAVEGTGTYPDATFTLRLAYGTVTGYRENGAAVPPWTTVAGAFRSEQQHGGQPPWQLPANWHAHQQQLDQQTPFNFVCTADIIGGNSGSPVVNRQGELVGVIFDGNIQSLTGDYFYSDQQARAVSVATPIVLESLRTIYRAQHLVEELGR